MIKSIFEKLERKCDKLEHYFQLYDRYFSPYIGKSPKILEIGVQHGGSAELWSKYFGRGTFIHGVDINPLCGETEYLKLYRGNQGDAAFWLAFPERDFDIIIDDGSHNNPHMILTLDKTFKWLKDGGIYWAEDVHTSYYHNVRVDDGGLRNPKSFVEYCKHLIDVTNDLHTHMTIGVQQTPTGPHLNRDFVNNYDSVQGIHFHDSIVVIDKGPRLQYKSTRVNY
jgi:hypothetical protein